MNNTLNLAIEGMHCGACVRRVTSALQGVDGVQVSSIEIGLAKITFDDQKASAKEISAAVDRIGFTTRVE